jgi:aminoglycoside phosphotransferase (APT) family kinase protein
MERSEVRRAVAVARSTVSALGMPVEHAVVVNNSNNLAVRLLPCDVLARVAPVGRHLAEFEIDLAQRLARARCPVAVLDPRVAPQVYERDGFVLTFWRYYETERSGEASPDAYAKALARLHAGMRTLDVGAPHFTDRVDAALRVVVRPDGGSSALDETDRRLVGDALRALRRSITERGAREQLLHGEPHPGNVLMTDEGVLFIDLETCCRGPIELDLADVPEAVSDRYPGLDPDLLVDCRGLVLAMVAAWRCDPADQFPDGPRFGRALVGALKEGRPWPSFGALFDPFTSRP